MRRPGGFDGGASKDRPRRNERTSREQPVRRTPVEPAPSEPSRARSEHANVPRVPAHEPSEPAPIKPARMPNVTSQDTVDLSEHSRSVPRSADREHADAVRRAKDDLKQAERQRRRREKSETKRFTGHVRARRRRLLIVVLAVVGLAGFVAVGVYTPIMAVEVVEVRGAEAVSQGDVEGALSRFEGVPLALVTEEDVHTALEPFPLIQRYAIERIPPHTLVVRIEERLPVIALEREGSYDLYDPAGVLLHSVTEPPAGVPVGSLELTDTTSPAFLAASAVVRDMPEDLRGQLVAVRATNAQDVTFTLVNGLEVLWGEADQTQRKSAVLRALMASLGEVVSVDISVPDTPTFK